MRKSEGAPEHYLEGFDPAGVKLTSDERNILRLLSEFPQVVAQAGESYSPAVLANYCFEVAKLFNHYYQDTPILKRVDPEVAKFRVLLSLFTGKVIKSAMKLLGIDVPEKM